MKETIEYVTILMQFKKNQTMCAYNLTKAVWNQKKDKVMFFLFLFLIFVQLSFKKGIFKNIFKTNLFIQKKIFLNLS